MKLVEEMGKWVNEVYNDLRYEPRTFDHNVIRKFIENIYHKVRILCHLTKLDQV
jgi:hypothetical protein